jgi:hypothetical protein
MEPTQMRLSSAKFRGMTVGVVENAHGDVCIYNPFTKDNMHVSNLLRWDGNEPIIVDPYLLEVEEAITILCSNPVLDFNVQDLEYRGTFEEIEFHNATTKDMVEEIRMKEHAMGFLQHIWNLGTGDADIDLDAEYAEYVNSK